MGNGTPSGLRCVVRNIIDSMSVSGAAMGIALGGVSRWFLKSYFPMRKLVKGELVGECECGGNILKAPDSGKERCSVCKKIGRFKHAD